MTKSGFVAIVGRPNVGKSTLINALIGKKIAITSDKPQTTRHRISGILTKDDAQIIFVDTPGMHKGKDLLNKQIDKTAVNTLQDVDSVLYVVDRKFDKAQAYIIHYFEQVKIPVYLVINKIDALDHKAAIDEIILSYLPHYPFEGVFPISALNKIHLEHLVQALIDQLKEGPFYYPEDQISDQSDETLIKEFIREKILYHTRQEVPHAVGVMIESFAYNEKEKTYDVGALIIVERKTQKLILIGKNGELLKKIGTDARLDLNKRLQQKIHLTLWIKVKKDWRNQASDLKTLGYSE